MGFSGRLGRGFINSHAYISIIGSKFWIMLWKLTVVSSKKYSDMNRLRLHYCHGLSNSKLNLTTIRTHN